MDARTLRSGIARVLPVLAAAAGIGALILLALSVENSASFGRSRLWIVSGNAFAVLVLAWLLARKVWQLVRDFRDHVPGSRLTMRTVGIFGALVAAPLLVVYFFSLDFLNRGIDSWFQIEIRQGLNDALVLSRSALDLRRREQLQRTEAAAREIASLSGPVLLARLDQWRRAMEVSEVVVYDATGRPLAVSSADTQPLIPAAAPRDVLLQLARGREYMSLQPVPGGQYRIVTATPIYPAVNSPQRRYLLVNYEVPVELTRLADAVQDAYTNYGNLSELRQPLIISFQLALTLVLLLTMLAAIYGAIFSAQRLTRPVQDLIAGTRAVGKGDFGTRLALPSRDEMGYLVHSFNDMTKRLRRASEEAEASKRLIDSERQRLAVILSRLSSGVLVVDGALHLLNANDAAGAILGWKPDDHRGEALTGMAGDSALLRQFLRELQERLAAGRTEWREQLDLVADGARRVLLWACTPLPSVAPDGGGVEAGENPATAAASNVAQGGVVVVFDDITNLLTAQRNAAWGEVARRLAHEIKNPLTPIQLSAERLRRKLRSELTTESAQLLDRATHTIVQQVDAMQQMVNAFSDYARAPEMRVTRFALNQLVVEVAELYRLQDQRAEIRLQLDSALGEIQADRGRLRQVLANLISNALHAISGAEQGVVEIATQLRASADGAADVQLQVSDNGPGFSAEVLQHAFEPYVTSKARGTGLGLAIVKRIVEEHAGQVEAGNRPQGGAVVRINLPLRIERRAAEARRERA
jgi:nitrogen fixation/metabolism regulation signal transduction histidine kinase